jgi:hypothetical protein
VKPFRFGVLVERFGDGHDVLGTAAREADTIGLLAAPIAGGVIAYDDDPSTRAPERMARQVDWNREAAGERFERIELSTMVSPVVAGDRGAAAEALAAARGWSGLPPEAVLARSASSFRPSTAAIT